MKKIGILGGSFDPVQNEHVELARAAIKELKLNRLIIMPAGSPPHKDKKELSLPYDRLMMAKLAFGKIDGAEVGTYELSKEGKSYTFETLEYIKGKNEGASLYFIMGADMLLDFPTWKNPERITKVARLAVAGRGYELEGKEKVVGEIKRQFGAKIKFLKFCGGKISSTKVRLLCEFGCSIEGLVPDGIREYIEEHSLYEPDEIIKKARNYLTEKRARHSALVAALALEKSKELNIPKYKIITSAALHDVAKKEEEKKYEGFKIDDSVPAPVRHQYLGAYIAEKEFGIEDEDILNAVRYHTSGREDMSDLEKLIFTCDMIEESRNFKGVERLRKLYYGNFEECFEECLKASYKFLKKSRKREDIYIETKKAYEYYKRRKKDGRKKIVGSDKESN